MGFQRRYDPDLQALWRLIRNGVVGKPVLYRTWHRNARAAYGPRSNAEVLVNSAIHDLDEVRWLSGQEVRAVRSVVGCRVDRSLAEGVFDLQLIQLELGDGALALVELNLSAGYGYEVGAEVCGERGSITAGLPAGAFVRVEGDARVHVPADWLERFDAAYAAEVAAWVEHVRAGQAWPHAWDGYASLVVAEACAEALATGRPVSLTPEPPPPLYVTPA
ncbi:MAG: Gfo/Idh/MocA family oxidoreductase [Armatimonadetes bacterium]|nr:Gfo/Idh/MocA family oxidoreductase [Armatimonadota bacterium]